MNTTNFSDLYKGQKRDDLFVVSDDKNAFSLVRKYPETSLFNDERLRMSIKMAVLENGLYYSVYMTEIETVEGKTEYIIQFNDNSTEYTNLSSDRNNLKFVFDQNSKKIKHVMKSEEFTLNEFVDILEKNHLSDCLCWKRKANWCVTVILESLFWLNDERYEVETERDIYDFKKDGKIIHEESKKDTEPFFKYFYISKNFIFLLSLGTFFCAVLAAFLLDHFSVQNIWTNLLGEFTLANPFVVLFFFIVLFTAEKISTKLGKKIKDFLMPNQYAFLEPKENFIEDLHNYRSRNYPELKLTTPMQARGEKI